MKSVGQILKPYEKKLRRRYNAPVDMDDILKLEFLRNPYPLLDAILYSPNFTKRQIKILLFIARFSIGCRRSTAHLKQSNFKEIGIYPSDVKKELQKLKKQDFIGWNNGASRLWITRKLLSKTLTKPNEKVSEILTRNLVNHQQKVSNSLIPTNQKHRQEGKNNNR